MGRGAGYIALWCGLANGSEEVLLPEKYDYNEEALIERVAHARELGKQHYIIINAEGVGHSQSMAKRIEEATGSRHVLQFLDICKEAEAHHVKTVYMLRSWEQWQLIFSARVNQTELSHTRMASLWISTLMKHLL